MLLLPVLAWLLAESGKHAKPRAQRLSSRNRIALISGTISTNSNAHWYLLVLGFRISGFGFFCPL